MYLRDEPDQLDAVSDDSVVRKVLYVLLLVIRLKISQVFFDLSDDLQVVWIEFHLRLYIEYRRDLPLSVLDQ